MSLRKSIAAQIYELLSEHHALSTQQIAEHLDYNRDANTIRRVLNLLYQKGLLRYTTDEPTGVAGRPSKIWELTTREVIKYE